MPHSQALLWNNSSYDFLLIFLQTLQKPLGKNTTFIKVSGLLQICSFAILYVIRKYFIYYIQFRKYIFTITFQDMHLCNNTVRSLLLLAHRNPTYVQTKQASSKKKHTFRQRFYYFSDHFSTNNWMLIMKYINIYKTQYF